MTRWGSFRGKGRQPTLRARLCVQCNAERAFVRDRCTFCKSKLPRASKFGNVATTINGVRFHSKKEAARFGELQWLERQEEITGLERQVPYDLDVNGVHVTRYIADFRYRENGAEVVEDSKGFRTVEYQLKKRLLLACFGIAIKET